MKSKNKLMIITDAWGPFQTNGVVTTLENCVIEAQKDGWKVTVISPDLFKNFPAPGNDEVRLSLPIGLNKMIKQSNPDYIHIATEGPLGFAAMLWCRLRGKAYTTAYHTKWPEFLEEIYGLDPKITTSALKFFHKKSESVLTTTDTLVDELYYSGISEKGVAWTRGVNEELFHSPRYETTQSNKIKLLSVGRASKEKNLDAFCELNPELYDLTVVGDGPYLTELKSRYPHVKFVGKKKGKELVDFYRNADVMVFTSLTDTFGLVMIESMYMGTPVAAFNVTGPNEVISNRITGCVNTNIDKAIVDAYALDRKNVSDYARYKWSWKNAWQIMKENLSQSEIE
jgi:glycosyltransferase involved in cell wall biosynthesis